MKVCKTCSRRYPDNAIRCPEDQSLLVPLTDATRPVDIEDLIGRRMFGDYVIESKLGEGGMGSVFLAKHVSIDQSIAIKVLHGHAAENSELIQRFNREARAIARLTHPNIIRVFIFGRTPEGLIYLAMEYVKGESVRSLIEKKGRLSELHSIYILKQVLGALAEAHELGIIHRDLKPDNILLTEYRGNPEFVKVVDFGIAKVKEPDGQPEVQLTQAGVVYGTPEYLSPEQAQAKLLDGRSDLYSLGIILWEMLTGDVPFTGNTAMSVLVQHVYDPPGDPLERNPHLSSAIVRVLDRALQKDPAKRYQTASEFLEALEDCERTLEAVKKPVSENLDAVKTQLWTPPPEFLSQPGANSDRDAPSSRVDPLARTAAAPPRSQPAPAAPGVQSAPPARRADAPVAAETRAPGRARQVVITALIIGLIALVIMLATFLFVVMGDKP